MMDLDKIRETINQVDCNLKKEEYQGIDPYDALNSQFITSLNSKLTKLAFTQLLVYSPLNLRKPLKINAGRNPKGLALILSAYSVMKKNELLTDDDFKAKCNYIISNLNESVSNKYSRLARPI
jgi:hypothetical protein